MATNNNGEKVPTVAFTKQWRDRSTTTGFQFEFFCDRGLGRWFPSWLYDYWDEGCRYSYVTAFQVNAVGMASKVVEAANWFVKWGDNFKPEEALNNLNKGTWEYAHSNAVQEAKRHFRKCPNCSKWVCVQACWVDQHKLCKSCAPTNSMGSIPMPAAPDEKRAVLCAFCGEPSDGGKFCATCGKPALEKVFCGNCGGTIEKDKGYKFCPHCGDSLAYLEGLQP